MCFLCDQYEGVPVSLTTHISVMLLPEQGNARSHRHGGRKSVLWVNYNDIIKTVHAYQKEHGVDGRIDPRAQRTQGTLGERIAAGDPDARAELGPGSLQWLLSGPADEVAIKVSEFDRDVARVGAKLAAVRLRARWADVEAGAVGDE